ncbi:MAG: hydroxymethylglutaryl-CoA synthase family protein [Bradymonadales bacterium]|nr:hydroxymethylglutaryl-CoA synthase family protein [Bradymonadales bacterium]
MTGIVSFGAYLPRLRLDRKAIFAAMGWFNPVTFGAARGEKAVANHDEDSVTLAVEAARDCLACGSKGRIGALFAASTTFPYLERMNAALIASALDLQPELAAQDSGGAATAGTTSLLSALSCVTAGEVEQALVTASDCRLGKPGSGQEHVFGDGAASMLVGRDDVIATYLGSHSIRQDFPDQVRQPGRLFGRSWEERWIREEGYQPLLQGAIQGLLAKTEKSLTDLAKVCIACPDPRTIAAIGKKLRLTPEQLVDPLLGSVGDTGCAHALLLLASALAESKPGDLILVAGYGSGADALLFQATEALATFGGPAGVKPALARRVALVPYEKYLTFREILPVELGIRGEIQAPTALSALSRERRAVLGLVGMRCTACGTPQFPPQHRCVNPECRAMDTSEPYPFSSRTGTVFSYTGDMLAFSFDPPAAYGLVDMAGGGRLNLDFTDCTLDELKVGMEVALTFRRKYVDRERGLTGYFWKATPLRVQ